MKRKKLKTYAFILVSALTVLSSCETSARYIGSNEWSGSVNQVIPPTYILTFSIYYGGQLQSVPEYASLYYTGDTNGWGYDEVIDNHNGTYSVYIYETLNDGYWYDYGLIMDHTGNDTELSGWTYLAFDQSHTNNPIDPNNPNNLYFVYDSSKTGAAVTIYSSDHLYNIIHDPATYRVNVYLDIVFSSNAGSLASGTDLIINGNMTGWISAGSQYSDDMVLVKQSDYTYRYTFNGAYKGESYEFKCSIGYQTNKIFSWANEITSSNGYTTVDGNWYINIPETASDGDIITSITYEVQTPFATLAPAIPTSGNPTYVIAGNFSTDYWTIAPSSDNLKLYCSNSTASMYWERDIKVDGNGTDTTYSFRVSTSSKWSSTVNYTHFDTSSPVVCTSQGPTDYNIIVPSNSTTYHVIIDMTCTAHTDYYIYVSET